MAIVFTIIGLSILIFIHELGHFSAAKLFGVRVDEFGFGFPPRLFSKKRGETTYSVNALPFGGFVRIYGEEGTGHGKRAFNAQPVWRRLVMVAAGVLANLVVAWLTLSAVFMVGAPEHLMFTGVAQDSPAAAAGLARGDVLSEVRTDGMVLQDPVDADQFIAAVSMAAETGSSVVLVTGSGETAREATVVPRQNPPAGEGPLGVSLAAIGVPQEPFFGSLLKGAEETWALTKLIVAGLAEFFGNVFQKPELLEEVSGPVGVAAAASQAGSLGAAYLLHFLGLISVNLMILNFIPFPALDGGRALFLIIEKIKGSPLPLRFEQVVNTVGFAFLLLLMILVTVQDIVRL